MYSGNLNRACLVRGVLFAGLALSASLPPHALAQDAAATGSDATAPAATVAVCAVCHGDEGEGNAKLGAPRIGGLTQWYVARQLEHFRDGIRAGTDDDVYGTQMRAIALTLESTDVISTLAQYVSTLSPPAAPKSTTGDAEHGKQLYTVCAACHGADGRGNEQLNAPSLVGQFDWYLVRQLENYADGTRGKNPADTFGMQMGPIMQTVPTHQDIVDVVAYIGTL